MFVLFLKLSSFENVVVDGVVSFRMEVFRRAVCVDYVFCTVVFRVIGRVRGRTRMGCFFVVRRVVFILSFRFSSSSFCRDGFVLFCLFVKFSRRCSFSSFVLVGDCEYSRGWRRWCFGGSRVLFGFSRF